jgi:hypothetical protein
MERQADSKETRGLTRRNIQKLHKCPSSQETAREVQLYGRHFGASNGCKSR